MDKLVISKAGLIEMLAILDKQHLGCIQIRSYSANNESETLVISAKSLLSSSEGYGYTYNFKITDEVNNMGAYKQITVAPRADEF